MNIPRTGATSSAYDINYLENHGIETSILSDRIVSTNQKINNLLILNIDYHPVLNIPSRMQKTSEKEKVRSEKKKTDKEIRN